MFEFFTDPWNMTILNWTLLQLVSALLQIVVGYSVIKAGVILVIVKG